MQKKNCHPAYAHTPYKIDINGYDSAVLFSHLHADGTEPILRVCDAQMFVYALEYGVTAFVSAHIICSRQ